MRLVENPTAPAAMPSATSAAIAATSSGVAGSFAAPRSPITQARTGPCGTWAAKSTARSSVARASRYSGNVDHRQRIPSTIAAPGMSSTPSIKPMSQSRRSSRAGANPTPQFPITTVVTPCPDDGETSGSQVTCAS